MDKSNIAALKTWWEDDEFSKYGGQGVLKDREQKAPGVYAVNYINALYRSGDKTFNFHIPTTQSNVTTLSLYTLNINDFVCRYSMCFDN